MVNQSPFSINRIAGIIFILGTLACFIGAGLYTSAQGFDRGPVFHTWERSLFAAAVILNAIGFVLLEDTLHASAGRPLAIIGTAGYFFAAILLVSGEAIGISLGFERGSILIAFYVIMAYLAQASIGGALLQSRMLAPWIGWVSILWNLAWLLALLIVGSAAGYIPLLHQFMPLVLGIALLLRKNALAVKPS